MPKTTASSKVSQWAVVDRWEAGYRARMKKQHIEKMEKKRKEQIKEKRKNN
jgi:hypothetical protein